MATPYSTIYGQFLDSIGRDEILKYSDIDLQDTLYVFLTNSVAKFKNCNQDLSNRTLLSYGTFNITLTQEEINILVLLMKYEWITTKVHTEELMRTSIGDRDYNVGSNAQMLKQLQELRDSAKREYEDEMRSYSFNDFEGLG